MNEIIKKYVKERDEMLLKKDVGELRNFVNSHAYAYEKYFIEVINKVSDDVLELVLHKMIVNCTNLPFDFRQKSADWLLERGLKLDL